MSVRPALGEGLGRRACFKQADHRIEAQGRGQDEEVCANRSQVQPPHAVVPFRSESRVSGPQGAGPAPEEPAGLRTDKFRPSRDRSTPGPGRLQCPVQSPTEQLEPLDRLVGEHEADVAIADIATPTSHGRCRHMLLKQAVRDLNAVESQCCDIEEQGPGSCRADRWQTVELTKRLVAPPLTLGVREVEMVVGQAKSDPRTDLVEPARRETVVDLYARDIVDQIVRRDDPADPPCDHALLE
jgi:hypothetical protein